MGAYEEELKCGCGRVALVTFNIEIDGIRDPAGNAEPYLSDIEFTCPVCLGSEERP